MVCTESAKSLTEANQSSHLLELRVSSETETQAFLSNADILEGWDMYSSADLPMSNRMYQKAVW